MSQLRFAKCRVSSACWLWRRAPFGADADGQMAARLNAC
jgi:hypothetical protein